MNPPDPITDALLTEGTRFLDGTLYYEHSHRLARQYWVRVNGALGLLAALTAAAGAGANLDKRSTLAVGLSLAAAMFAAALAFFKPAERATQHQAACNALAALRGDARRYKEIDLLMLDSAHARKRLDELAATRTNILTTAPDYSQKTYDRACKAISAGLYRYSADDAR